MNDPAYVVCDSCGDEIPPEEANEGKHEWQGETLCNDCYAEIKEVMESPL